MSVVCRLELEVTLILSFREDNCDTFLVFVYVHLITAVKIQYFNSCFYTTSKNFTRLETA